MKEESKSVADFRVRTAIILAAGNGSRIQDLSLDKPKPLLSLGGLLLIERAILNLKAAGIEKIRVVVGYKKEQIIATLKGLKSLRNIDLEIVECPQYELGNGASLAAGVGDLNESFLLTMSDHVMSSSVAKDFLLQVAKNPNFCALATDPQIAKVFDLDDATKVKTREGVIEEIGKEIPQYDCIDTGLFYFSKASCELIREAFAKSAHSVSHIVAAIRAREDFRVEHIAPNAFWQDVDTPAMAREAEKRMLNSLRKPTDGWISKNLNRHCSLAISQQLVRWGVHPNAVTTVVFFVSLYAAYLAATGNYISLVVAGLIFQICSIVDGCDGEIARLTFKGSHFGAWYDTLTDNIRYGVFFGSLGIGAYRLGGSDAYLWGLAFFIFSLTYMVASMIRYERQIKAATHLVVTARIEKQGAARTSWWDKIVMPLRGLIKQDVSAFVVMLFCLAGLGQYMFWIACLAILVMTLTVMRALEEDERKQRHLRWLIESPYLAFIVGVTLLGTLMSSVSLSELSVSLSQVGLKYLWIFFLAPPIWFISNALSLGNLLSYRVKLSDLLYNQVVGESYNALLPLAGLGGEPFKIKHLSQWLPVGEVTKRVVQDRLLHVLSGLVWTAGLGIYVLVSMDVPAWLQAPLLVMLMAFGFLTGILVIASFSRIPGMLAGKVLRRMRISAKNQDLRFSFSSFLISFCYKMLGRAGTLLESYVLFRALGYFPNAIEVVSVTFFISASSVIFFMMPQGVGVNEAGVVGAFRLAGLLQPMAVAFAVARRIRVLFWAVFGILLSLCVSMCQRFNYGLDRLPRGGNG
jgi:choline kinase/phosphatidylglycerophosphate synthase